MSCCSCEPHRAAVPGWRRKLATSDPDRLALDATVAREEAAARPWSDAARARLAVLVNDAEAVYPVRIDPTFSDANWIGMGQVPGTDRDVYAAAVDGSEGGPPTPASSAASS